MKLIIIETYDFTDQIWHIFYGPKEIINNPCLSAFVCAVELRICVRVCEGSSDG